MQQGPRHFSSIAMLVSTRALEMKLVFLSLISTHQFTAMDHEDPYTHLATFYEWVETIGFNQLILKLFMCLFPFSLVGKAKE